MRCRNFFSAAIRQGSGAWRPCLDNNSWICLFFTLVALSHHGLVFPYHPTSIPLPSFLSATPPHLPHSPFSLFLCPCLPQRFVQPTVVAMAFVCRAAAAAMTAGWAPGVTRGRVTLAATSMALARMGNVNAAPAGMESTAPLVGTIGRRSDFFCVCCARDSRRVCLCVGKRFRKGGGGWVGGGEAATQAKAGLSACVCEVLCMRGRVLSEKRGESMLN